MNSGLRYLCAGALLLAPLATSACNPVPGPGITTSDDQPGACDPGTSGGGDSSLQLTTNRDVDILFVIDNSGSMGPHQVKLNAGIDELFDRLDEAQANYRIGFTTTDNGNPWCPAGQTTPEGGKLVLSPCTTRLGDFLFNGGEVDVQDLACNDQCALGPAALEIQPTTTDVDQNPTPRQWLERNYDATNLPAGTLPREAFRCFAPQGVNGCGFESPLESAHLSLLRAQDSNEDSYGFLRTSAILAVVFITDEYDCSYNRDHEAIFDSNGTKIFWEDPTSAFPSSAVCWNAGVSCIGDPSGYDSCDPTDFDPNGSWTENPADAVLHPLSRYRDLLQSLEQDKQQLNPNQELIVMAITGVEGNGEAAVINYADATDPDFQRAFGIGPGCTGTDGLDALPPARMRELSTSFSPDGLYSTCDADYGEAMAALGERISAQIVPTCFTQCVADGDPTTPQLEPNCRLEMDPPGSDNHVLVQPCAREAGVYVVDPETGEAVVPEGEDLCYVARIDKDGSQTADPLDDMSSLCTDEKFNLEFDIVRRPGWQEPSGTAFSTSCTLSGCPDLECEGIGG